MCKSPHYNALLKAQTLTLCLCKTMKINLFKALKNFLAGILVLGVTCGILAISAVVAFFYWAAQDLPDMDRIAEFDPPQATIILARDGSPLGSLYHEKRFTVPLSLMSSYIPKAFLAAEDDGFYRHEGVDPMAIARAAIINFQTGQSTQGGSTITQQVVKQLLLTPEKSYKRKVKEAILAYRLENHLSKDEILTVYLNQIFLGQHSYGVEAAARTYFGKHATDITLAESALLAGIPQAPSRYNPFRNPKSAKARQMYVLGRLRELQWITQAEYEQAATEPLVYWTMPDSRGGAAAWYMEEVRRLLIDFFNEANLAALGLDTSRLGEDFVYEAGLTVTTAMDPIHQEAAALGLRKALEDLTKRQGWRGPIENIAPEQREAYLAKTRFSPYDLVGGKWVQGLVTKVEKSGADVALGKSHVGRVDVKTMSWGRVPNIRVIAAYAPAIKDATKILKEGDVIWLSAPDSLGKTVKEKGKEVFKEPTYDPAAFNAENPIPLALEQMPAAQGALASIEPATGDVVALIGGYEFGTSHFNRATQALRQPGSAFKPIVYSTAIDQGFTASSMLLDAPIYYVHPVTKQVWSPGNYSGKYEGPIELYRALSKSLNTCTVRVAQHVGVPAIIERSRILGLEGHIPDSLAISLGAVDVTPLNMTQSYTAFANQGWAARPRIITSIKDAQGRELYKQEPEHWQAITPQNAYIMTRLLQRVVTSGTATRARVLNKPMAGKTGTTNKENDAWFVGYTPHLVTGVYIGYDQRQPLGRREAGGYTALPAFVAYRKKVEEFYAPDEFVRPPGIIMIGNLAYDENEPIDGVSAMDGEELVIDVEQGEDLFRQFF